MKVLFVTSFAARYCAADIYYKADRLEFASIFDICILQVGKKYTAASKMASLNSKEDEKQEEDRQRKPEAETKKDTTSEWKVLH
ncbi:hypothetical protein C5167_015211 [Papaver somniferum]|uniref:Uncharacterized protein n=1 Tax=Papaver somniferum TaxID=3469 RepID=A0A4Y7J7B1_PAPSO|nr:hypothetical protein C5167_015211 [Papaver somniferum]